HGDLLRRSETARLGAAWYHLFGRRPRRIEADLECAYDRDSQIDRLVARPSHVGRPLEGRWKSYVGKDTDCRGWRGGGWCGGRCRCRAQSDDESRQDVERVHLAMFSESR